MPFFLSFTTSILFTYLLLTKWVFLSSINIRSIENNYRTKTITMSAPIRILIIGMNAEINSKITATCNEDKSLSARGFIVSNNPESDVELIDVIKQKDYDAIILGQGLRKQIGWFERVESLVKNNTDLPTMEVGGRTVDSVRDALRANGVLIQ